MIIPETEFGRIEVTDVPLPAEARNAAACYTPSGRMFVLYRTDDDPVESDVYHAVVLDDDGANLHPIFSGAIPEHAKANGIRHMMFSDNRRVLLGDYVLECTPDLDTCERAELVPVHYPWGLEGNPLVTHHWSEIIVSPDDEHIAWTILRTDMGAAAAIGRLRRQQDRYVVEDPKIISTIDELLPAPGRPGCVVPQPMRGGEVKQFVRGGTALSIVGGVDGPLPDSVLQDLASEQLDAITRCPGYDETTLLSPDERLGIVMTSRASARTDPAICGLLPRPHAMLTGAGLAWIVYTYTVAGVRAFREGNVGPVLIDVERSRLEPGYRGVPLHDPAQEWVYVSPMSWHPHGHKASWLEMLRGTEVPGQYRTIRIRTAELLDHEPGEPVPVRPTPERIPYAITGPEAEAALRTPTPEIITGRIAGRHSGHLDYERRTGDIATGRPAASRSTYVDFSDDGRSVYSGTEEVVSSFTADTVYTADLEVTGERSGEMRLRMTWSGIVGPRPATLRFETAEDGRPKSYGFARWGDRRLDVDELAE